MAVFTIIGDIVGSRRLPSRADAQHSVTAALSATSELVAPLDRLEATVGDEFQGVYATFSDATLAVLLVRLHLVSASADMDVRCGLGCGEREILGADRTPMLQDGPAWWSARAALDNLGSPAARRRRSWYDGRHADGAGPPEQLANAFLLSRDALVDRLNPRARDMLLASLGGANQRAIAAALRVSQPAVSQAFAKGVGAISDAQAMLSELGSAP